MGSCAAPSAKGDDKFITTDYLQQCRCDYGISNRRFPLQQTDSKDRPTSVEVMSRNTVGEVVVHPASATGQLRWAGMLAKHYD
jgi:hypothetical protein